MSSAGKQAVERLDVIRRHLFTHREALGGGGTTANPIIFYDILCGLEGSPTWSPNVLKARMTLNYKNLPYRVERISYPDIRPRLVEMGHVPSAISSKGAKFYTLPAISDPSKQADGRSIPIVDSYFIAEYLDLAYPSSPKCFPEGTEAFQSFFIKHLAPPVMRSLEQLVVPSVTYILDDRGAEYFRRTREVYFGKKIEDICRDPEERKVQYETLQKALNDLNNHYEKVDAPGSDSLSTRIMGMNQEPCFVDLWIASTLYWTKIIPVSHDQGQGSVWDAIKNWNKGRWAKILAEFEKYAI